MNWKAKKVLVSGSEGMIGKELVEQLKKLEVKGNLSEDGPRETDIKWFNGNGHDLRDIETCEYCLDGIDYVFHLAGVKGNPKMTNERPVDFMGPMLQFDTNMILTAQKAGVKRFLYTSSIAVENPESDKYPAWAKKTGETLIEAMRIQYPKGTKYCIVRPSNVYGRYDNFDNKNSMVVTTFIRASMENKMLILDKEGSQQIRDFINSKDVARGMIKAMEEMPDKPVNLCSGQDTSIEYLAELVTAIFHIPIEYRNLYTTLGPSKKVMKSPYIEPQISLEKGIKEVIEYAKS